MTQTSGSREPTPIRTKPPEEVDGQMSLFDVNEDGSITLNPEALPDGVTPK